MSESRKAHAEEWLIKGDHDIEMAQLLYNERGYTETIAFLIQQAVEKYVKGFLVFRGVKPKRTHDLERLLDDVIEIDKSFEKFIGMGTKITKYYIDSRYPIGFTIEYSREEIKQSLDEAYEIIAKIKQAIK
jgi:HEPN domain-containing protein